MPDSAPFFFEVAAVAGRPSLLIEVMVADAVQLSD